MEMAGLSQDAIDQVTEFTGQNDDAAIRYLKHFKGDTARAINAILEGAPLPDDNPVDNSWDDSAWTTDNAGNAQEEAQPAFNEFLQPNTAPSRPPSRVSNKSKAGSTRDASQYTSMSQEDWDMQRATKLSLGQDPGPAALPQQTGVVDSSGQTYFGPATRTQYDASQWALTKVDNAESTEELVDHPEDPFERKRNEGEPATLSPVSQGEKGFNPALITILHAIPAARNGLIFPDHQQEDLGHLGTWYQGDPINQDIVVNDLSNLKREDLDIVFEIQRLIAFLDESERKYARPKHLADIFNSLECRKGDYAKVLEKWLDVADKVKPDLGRRKLFTTRVVYATKGQETDFEDDVSFHLELDGPIQNIYEKFNSVLWPALDRCAFVREASDVICIDIHQNPASQVDGLGLSIPPTIYLDRYLEENLDGMQSMNEVIHGHDLAAKRLRERMEQISRHTPLTSPQKIVSMELLETTISILEAEQGRKQSKGLNVDSEEAGNDDGANVKNGDTVQQLEGILTWLKQKVDEITKQIEEHQEAIQEARLEMMREDLAIQQHHRYSLRGVSVDGKKTFVLRPSEPSSVPDPWTSSTEQDGLQWWCQDFTWSSTKDFSVTKVSVEEVINDTSNNGKDVLLVYANDKACSEQNIPLPPALHNFVAQDNLFFNRELRSYPRHETSRMEWESDDADIAPTTELEPTAESQEHNVDYVEQEADPRSNMPNITTSTPPLSTLVSQLRSAGTDSGSPYGDSENGDGAGSISDQPHGLPNLTWNATQNEYEERLRAAQQGHALLREDYQAIDEEQAKLGRDLTLKERREFLMRRLQGAEEGTRIWEDVDMEVDEGSRWKGG